MPLKFDALPILNQLFAFVSTHFQTKIRVPFPITDRTKSHFFLSLHMDI